MGSKTEARGLVKKGGVPVVPGTEGTVESLDEARAAARAIGYPVMLKAAAGGGGKGMRRVDDEQHLEAALRDASSEAERGFRNGAVYVEKLIEKPRHIEIQILGDQHGNMIHLGERECSIQRRHQKLIEESPSPLLASLPDGGVAMRAAMGDAAVRAAQSAGYSNAGTVEFLVDQNNNFYFLEMNTRLQVEHPVTELVTGLDLVHWQLRIAAGEQLTLRQEDIRWRGAAIECRVCAEDPENRFLPCPGFIERIADPSGPGVRLDSGVYSGWRVPIEYDPLLAKLVVWGPDRSTAIARARRAAAEYQVEGIRTNLGFFQDVLADHKFQAGALHTGFIEEFLARRKRESPARELEALAALIAAITMPDAVSAQESRDVEASRWRYEGRERLMR
jgi:acetyl-CoA carboxylase biotin carboxylase subunit